MKGPASAGPFLLPSTGGRTQKGMTETQNRVKPGIPTGGQYAATAHSDAVPVLAAPRVAHIAQLSGTIELHNDWFDDLPEWPAGLSEPKVNFGFDDGRVETYVTVDGKMKTFWDSGGWAPVGSPASMR